MKKITLLVLLSVLTLFSCHSGSSIQNPWIGKRVGFIGDSMTDPDVFKGEVKKYWEFLEDWLKIKPFVSAKDGKQWESVPKLAYGLYCEEGNNLDAIIVFMGTNDFNAAVPLGEWYTEKEGKTFRATGNDTIHEITRMEHIPNFDEKTFRGRLNIGIYFLKSTWPDKQIILLTPLHRDAAVLGRHNCQPDEYYQNECGEYFDAYVNAIKEAGVIWGVPVIDTNSLSGLNPMIKEQTKYYHNEYDHLHLNTKGNCRLAKTLMQQLLALPADFDDGTSQR